MIHQQTECRVADAKRTDLAQEFVFHFIECLCINKGYTCVEFVPTGLTDTFHSSQAARYDAQGQVYIELNESTESIITNLIKTCPSLRDTLRRGRVEKIKTNFYPSRSSDGQCRVYINGESKLVPTSSFELDVEQDVFYLPRGSLPRH